MDTDRSPAPATPPRGRPVARAALLWTLVLVAVLALPVAGLWGLMRSEGGTRWLLTRVPGLAVDGLQGALLGERLQIKRLQWQGPAGTLTLDALEIEQPRWQLAPAPGQWLGLQADRIAAESLAWRSGPPPAAAAPRVAPGSLVLPIQLRAPLALQTVQINDLAPLRGLALTLALGADGGLAHEVQDLTLDWDLLQARGGRLRVGSSGPLDVSGALALASADGTPLPWQATIEASGSLTQLALAVQLRGGNAAVLDIEAGLAPFAAWPLTGLSARTEGLDLATLNSALPRTRLSGQATLRSSAVDQPLEATLALRNDAPGTIDERRLPLRQLALTLRGRLDQPDTLEIPALDLQLASAEAAAGRVRGQGRWQAHTGTLDLTLQDLAPHRLDRRAAPMTLTGPLGMVLSGLPSPDPAASAPGAPPQVALDTRLEGQIDGAPQAVRLALQGTARDGDLQVRAFEARAGDARVELKAHARRDADRWVLDSEGALVDFDPLPWWPGPDGSAWRRGGHRLNASWTADLALPLDALALPPQAMAQRLRGDARLQVERSTLARVQLSADVRLDRRTGATLQGEIAVAGNRVVLDGRGDPDGDGQADRLQLELQAPALAALAPLAALHPAGAAWAPRAGQATARVRLQGRWPALRIDGEAALNGLRAGELSLAGANARWQVGGADPTPLDASVALTDLRLGAQRVQGLRAGLAGSLGAHRLSADVLLPMQPPPALVRSLGLARQKSTRIVLRGDGGWAGGPQGGRWAGRLQQFGVAGSDASALPPAAAADAPLTAAGWLDARDLQMVLALGPGGEVLWFSTAAGRARLAGGVGLRWDEVLYQGDTGRVALQAQVESFDVAPFLDRWQPTMGWTGDLQAGARIELVAAERFDADIVIERERGDLSVRDPAGNPMAMGLSVLRLGVSAHDGTWYFTQALAGKTLGEAGGALRVQTTADRRVPPTDAPLAGSLQARVADLGVWGAWVPAGWRLQGQLQTTATFGGSLGAPQVDGVLNGSGLGVRNLLEGVNVRDGEVAVRLNGETATIDRFTLKAGDGTLTLRGGATLGAEPQVTLALTAERFQLLGRIDRRLIASGQAELLLKPALLKLDGRVKVDEGLFDASRADAPTLDDDVVVRRPGAPEAPDDGDGADGPPRKTEVAIAIDLGQKLRVRGRGLDTRLAGQLRLTAPGGRLSVAGTVSTVEGTFAAYGQKMTIERGQVIFNGPVDTPRLDVLALRPKLEIEVGVEISGTAQTPRVRLYSNPDMSDTDKLSWLVLGRDPTSLGRTDTALLQRAAVALLAGEGEGPTDGLMRSLGLDDLSVRQSDGEVRETIVTLGRQISDRWYVGYERSVNATAGTWQLIYRAARRFTLRLQAGFEESIDAIWVWRVD